VPTIRDTAICIRHWDFSETSQTVSLFTREHGLLRGIAKGAKRERSRFDGGIDLLTRGEVVAIVKPARELATLTDWSVVEMYWSLRTRLAAHLAGLYFADLVQRLVHDHDAHPALFDAAVSALRALDDPAGDAATILRFQWAVLVESGYRPQLHADVETGEQVTLAGSPIAFHPGKGGLVADSGAADRWRVRPETISLLRRLEAGDDRAEQPPVSDEHCRRANLLLAAHLRHVIGEEPPVMRRVFPDLPRR
jgi:DNA repair protein RecO (recombination protein O)